MTKMFKICLNCNQHNRPLKRKCRHCGGDMFRCSTAEEIKSHEQKRQTIENILQELLKKREARKHSVVARGRRHWIERWMPTVDDVPAVWIRFLSERGQ